MSLGSCNLPKSLFKCTLLALSAGLVQSAIVRTSFGQLEGAQLQLDDGRLVHLFKKVPFAEPPVKELRFELPRPPSKWRKVRNAKEYGPACMSNSTQTSSPQKWVDEDCLHLNIFTSQACLETKDCPVLFYIHGGTVEYDSAVMFNDSILVQNFVSKDVVMVLAAFRLGIFSHLFFESQDVVPQNLAMYDVLQGLKFVNEEIENFGGDNSKVTLLGHSYGGAVAAALVYSPVEFEKQLFHQVAAMSTTMLFNKFDEQVAATWRFIEAAGCLPPNRRPAFPAHFRENYATECLRKLDQFTILGFFHDP